MIVWCLPIMINWSLFIPQCLYEVVYLLDLVCTYRKRMIHDVFPTLKSLYTRVSSEEGGARVSLAIIKFMITHSQLVVPLVCYGY